MSKLDESMENFLTEIEEYSKRLEEEKNLEKSNETNSDEEFEEVSDNLVDNFYKSRDKIMSLKENLETEIFKVKPLEDLVEKQQPHIKILTEEKLKENKEFNQKLVKYVDTRIEASVEKRKAVCSSM